jgi:gamma-glutamylcyclotransferase (GGCT)/AIG2-like uncharacterized protein YtfP
MPIHGDELLFVYGTLRRGGSHHDLLHGAPMLGDWTSGPHFDLLDMGPYPALIGGRGRVSGEIYRIGSHMLPALDAYEGCPGDYRRERIHTPFGEAWVYLWDRPAPAVSVIPGGDWLQHLAGHN